MVFAVLKQQEPTLSEATYAYSNNQKHQSNLIIILFKKITNLYLLDKKIRETASDVRVFFTTTKTFL